MLRKAEFSAADLEAWNSSNNAQKVALLGKLQERAGLPAQRTQESPGGRLGATAKEQVMESVLTPELPPGVPTRQEILEAERRVYGDEQPQEQGLPAPRSNIRGQVPLPPESMRNIVRPGQPAFNNPRLQGLSPEQIRPYEYGGQLSPDQEAERLRQVEELEQKGGYEAIDPETLRASRFEGPG